MVLKEDGVAPTGELSSAPRLLDPGFLAAYNSGCYLNLSLRELLQPCTLPLPLSLHL